MKFSNEPKQVECGKAFPIVVECPNMEGQHVTLSLEGNGNGKLSGHLIAVVKNGKASFDDVKIDFPNYNDWNADKEDHTTKAWLDNKSPAEREALFKQKPELKKLYQHHYDNQYSLCANVGVKCGSFSVIQHNPHQQLGNAHLDEHGKIKSDNVPKTDQAKWDAQQHNKV